MDIKGTLHGTPVTLHGTVWEGEEDAKDLVDLLNDRVADLCRAGKLNWRMVHPERVIVPDAHEQLDLICDLPDPDDGEDENAETID